jgi:hypothetical protein
LRSTPSPDDAARKRCSEQLEDARQDEHRQYVIETRAGHDHHDLSWAFDDAKPAIGETPANCEFSS